MNNNNICTDVHNLNNNNGGIQLFEIGGEIGVVVDRGELALVALGQGGQGILP